MAQLMLLKVRSENQSTAVSRGIIFCYKIYIIPLFIFYLMSWQMTS